MSSHSKESFCSIAQGNKWQRETELEKGDERGRGGEEWIPSNQLAVLPVKNKCNNRGKGDHKHTSTGEDVHRHLRDAKTEMGLDEHKVFFMPGLITDQQCSDRFSTAPPVGRRECCMQLALSSVTLH